MASHVWREILRLYREVGFMLIKDIIRYGAFCVLATSSNDRPHCSLMSYATDDECCKIFMMTLSDTQKFRNLTLNPNVSLLIDTRSEKTYHTASTVRALTVGGKIRAIDDADGKAQARQRLVEAHPDLRELAASSNAVLLCLEIESVQLFEGLKRVDEE